MLGSVKRSFGLLSATQKTKFLALVIARVAIQLLDVVALIGIGWIAAGLSGGFGLSADNRFPRLSAWIETMGLSATALSLIVVALFIAKTILAATLLRVTTKFLAVVETETASKVAKKFFKSRALSLTDWSTSEHIWAISQSSHIAMTANLFSVSAFAGESAVVASVFVVFMTIDSLSAILLFAYFALVFFFFQVVVNGRLRKVGEDLAAESVRVSENILSMTSIFREMTIFEKQDFFLGKFAVARAKLSVAQGALKFLLSAPRFVVELSLMFGFFLVVIAQTFFRFDGNQFVTASVFLAGGLRLMAAMLPLQNAVSEIRKNIPQAARAQDLLSVDDPDDVHLPGMSVISDKQEWPAVDISIRDLTLQYPNASSPAISNVSLDIGPGEFVAIIGPSGAGKSTLAELILGLSDADSGEIFLNGLRPSALRASHPGILSYVPQIPGMVAGTIRENVALGTEEDELDPERLERSLILSGLAETIASLPGQLDYNLGKHANRLSGGQLQRLGIARALYTNPRLLVLDEATSALDSGIESQIVTNIKSLAPEVTVVAITHRPKMAQEANRVIVIDNGNVVKTGRYEDILGTFKNPKEFKDLSGLAQENPLSHFPAP